MSRNHRRATHNVRISHNTATNDVWVVRHISLTEPAICATLRDACAKALEIPQSYFYSYTHVVGIGDTRVSYLPYPVVRAIIKGRALRWIYDGEAWIIVSVANRTASPTRQLNRYTTFEYACELNYTLLEMGANIDPDSLPLAETNYRKQGERYDREHPE